MREHTVAIKGYVEFIKDVVKEITSKDKLKLGEINILSEIVEGFENSLNDTEYERIGKDFDALKEKLHYYRVKYFEDKLEFIKSDDYIPKCNDISIYRLLLMKIFNCDAETLEKFGKLMSKCIKIFGTKTVNQVFKNISLKLESNELDVIEETFYFMFCYGLRRILNKKEGEVSLNSKICGYDDINQTLTSAPKELAKILPLKELLVNVLSIKKE